MLLPTLTFPKLWLIGFAVSSPGATPVPDAGNVRCALLAVLATAKLPLELPAVAGENSIENVVLCPALRVIGKVTPVKPNPAPAALTCEIITGDPPELVKVSISDLVLPT